MSQGGQGKPLLVAASRSWRQFITAEEKERSHSRSSRVDQHIWCNSSKKRIELREKSEARNPKFQTNSNDQNHEVSNIGNSLQSFDLFRFVWARVCFGFGASNFGFVCLRFVSDFVLRISNFLQ